MSKNSSVHKRQSRAGEGIITAISIGAVFILIGLIYVTTLPTNLWDKINAFFSSFTALNIPGTTISLPAPAVPGAHTVLYNAAFQFCLGIAILQIVVLALRFTLHSPINRTAETVGNLVFWFGASYLVITFLNNSSTVDTWFLFWAAILVALGVSMIARATVLFAKRRA